MHKSDSYSLPPQNALESKSLAEILVFFFFCSLIEQKCTVAEEEDKNNGEGKVGGGDLSSQLRKKRYMLLYFINTILPCEEIALTFLQYLQQH